MSKSVMILASGGIDSTACIHYYIERGYTVSVMHIDYGQKAFKPEKAALQSICAYFEIAYQSLCFHGIPWSTSNTDEIVGRNLLLAAIGIAAYDPTHGLIAMGIHAGSDYIDCSPDFQYQLSGLAQLLTRYHVDFDFPFGSWFKQDIVEYCKIHNVPIQLTYSCTKSDDDPCGSCSSCLDRLDYVDARGTIHGT